MSEHKDVAKRKSVGRAAPDDDGLATYRAKRDGAATPEPMGSVVENGLTLGRVFVVHEHRATRRHFDLRLEVDGVLLSWAVPHGPTMNPDEKRLAVKVEAHPVEYTTFEAVIPPGNYGAGPMIVWDRGRFLPVGDPAEGVRAGEIKFELMGYKLRGAFTLVRTGGKGRRGGDRDWLLIKKRDGWAEAQAATGYALTDTSVLSGLTCDELADGSARIMALRDELNKRELPSAPTDLTVPSPMLCETSKGAFTDWDWLFELKYDGYRLLASGGAGQAALRYRSGRLADRFVELAAAIRALPCPNVLLDGEVVVVEADGRPNFQLLHSRVQLARAGDIARMSAVQPVTYFAFDLLACDGHDLRQLPLLERKALLVRLLPAAGPLRFADHVVGAGEALFEHAVARNVEGIVGKRTDSTYVSRRSDAWLKIKSDATGDFAICGYTAPKGGRVGLGALHLCARLDDKWVYAGKVGTGLSDRLLGTLRAELDALAPWKPSFVVPLENDTRAARWVTPTLVCEVRYREWPRDHALRHPVFVRMRPDKTAHDTEVPDRRAVQPVGEQLMNEPAPSPPPTLGLIPRNLRYTNRDKIFWPAHHGVAALTKGELIDYYRAAAPYLLPYLRDRPSVLTRFPDGIDGPSFYQKDMPEWTPPWLRTTAQWSEHSQREVRYLLIDDADGLAYLANLGSIPIHTWSSRVVDLARPDWSIIDFDPKQAPREDVVPLALATHALCEQLGLPNYVKTSGQSGLHILIPLGGQCTHEQSRQLSYLLSMVVERSHPTMATTNRNPSARGGKVYLDWGQNAHGQLLVAPLVVRPVPSASVSMPLHWDEVVDSLDPTQFNLRNAIERMEKLVAHGGDPMLAVLTDKPDLAAALQKLSELLGADSSALAKDPEVPATPSRSGRGWRRW